MRIRFTLAAALLWIAAPAGAQQPAPQPPATAAERPSPPVEGVFSFGAAGADTTDYLGRAAEYDVLHGDGAATLGLQLWGERGQTRWEAFARHSGNGDDQRYAFDLNVNRRLKASLSYDRLPHRLDHDPLAWMDASSNIGGTFVVGHTDHDPLAEYALTRGELKSRIELALPLRRAGNVALFASHRQEMRDGVHQALTTNHCATCHTESFSREMDQRTRDLTAGAMLRTHAVTLDYAFTNREFQERAGNVTNVYSRALHPATLADVFLNRVAYDERSGALPFDSVPGLRKTGHDLRARVSLPGDANLTGAFTQSVSRNVDTQLEVDFTGTSGRLFVPLGRKLSFRAAIRRYDIDADSVLVDVNEPIAPAGLSAGQTYEQAFPQLGELDFLRESGLSRTPTTAEFDLIYRPFRRTTIRAGYEWEEIERDHYDVQRTVTHTVRGSVRARPWKTLQVQARAAYDRVRDPFARENAAMPLVLQPYASPGNLPFTGLQYFEFYRTRQADLTSSPARDGFLEQSLTWTPGERVSLTGHYRYRRALNDELNFSQWHQSSHVPGAQIWIAPGGPVNITAGYTYQRERTETGFATLAFVG
jgi:hypothetical protein